VETFVNHGEVSATRYFLPRQEGLSATAEGGDVVIRSIIVHELKSMWPTP
jgi:hypothetical protein